LIEITFGECLLFGQFYGYPIPDWRKGRELRTKIKGRFDELSKVRALKESIPDLMDELVKRIR
jgi:hypothetical protein